MPNPGAASSRPKIASLQARLGRPVDLGAVTVEGLLYLNSAEKRQSEQELAKTRFVVDVQAKLHALWETLSESADIEPRSTP
jgi:hypothetical protein